MNQCSCLQPCASLCTPSPIYLLFNSRFRFCYQEQRSMQRRKNLSQETISHEGIPHWKFCHCCPFSSFFFLLLALVFSAVYSKEKAFSLQAVKYSLLTLKPMSGQPSEDHSDCLQTEAGPLEVLHSTLNPLKGSQQKVLSLLPTPSKDSVQQVGTRSSWNRVNCHHLLEQMRAHDHHRALDDHRAKALKLMYKKEKKKK